MPRTVGTLPSESDALPARAPGSPGGASRVRTYEVPPLPFPPRLLALCLFALVLLAVAGSAPASAAPVLEACEPSAQPVACGGAISPTRPPVGTRALHAARSFLGVPYAWGGESRGGLDCSGLVVVSFRAIGRELPHYSGALWHLGRHVAEGALRPGDLVFFRLSGGVPGHVGIYAGRGRYIHAPSSGGVVRYGRMSDRADDFAGARRLR